MMTVGSLFSGVGGFDRGFEQAGCRIAWQCEIDPHARAVLRRHWPDVPLYGDIRELQASDLASVDVVIFGSPCQDLSVAGKRAGLGGERSGLFFEATRLIRELRPDWVVWENVAHALGSHSGRDFAAVLDALGDCGVVELGWRVLDAQFWGVPQRRRRVFVVGSARADGARAVLFESESSAGHPPTSGAAGQDAAGGAAAGTGDDRRLSAQRGSEPLGTQAHGPNNDLDTSTYVAELAPGALAPVQGGQRDKLPLVPVAGSDTARYGKGTDSDATDPLVLSQAENQRGELRTAMVAPALTAGGGKPGRGYSAIALHARQDPIHGALSPALDTDSSIAVMHSVQASAGHHGHSSPRGDGGDNEIVSPMRVRRLTPLECERLMGWEDEFTRWAADGKELSDSVRYRLIGNGVVAPVAEWLARRIVAVSQPP